MADLLLPAIIVAILAAGICVLALPLGERLRLVDYPGSRKHHTDPTPLAGGLVLLLAVLPVVMGWWAWAGQPEHYLGLVCATAAITILGLLDDIYDLSAVLRLVAATLVFGTLIYYDRSYLIRVLVFETPRIDLGLIDGWISAGLTLLAMVGLINALNMADGKNGLVIGLCIGWLSLLMTRTPSTMQPIIILLIVALTVLLIFNLQGRLFLGDGGAYGVATALGLLAIYVYNSKGVHAGRGASAEELAILLCIPVADSFRLIVERVRRGVSPFTGDRNHLHHQLQNRFGWPGGLWAYWAIAIIPAAALFLLH